MYSIYSCHTCKEVLSTASSSPGKLEYLKNPSIYAQIQKNFTSMRYDYEYENNLEVIYQ